MYKIPLKLWLGGFATNQKENLFLFIITAPFATMFQRNKVILAVNMQLYYCKGKSFAKTIKQIKRFKSVLSWMYTNYDKVVSLRRGGGRSTNVW